MCVPASSALSDLNLHVRLAPPQHGALDPCANLCRTALAEAGVFGRPAQDAAAHNQAAGMATGGALNPPPGQAFSGDGDAMPGGCPLGALHCTVYAGYRSLPLAVLLLRHCMLDVRRILHAVLAMGCQLQLQLWDVSAGVLEVCCAAHRSCGKGDWFTLATALHSIKQPAR